MEHSKELLLKTLRPVAEDHGYNTDDAIIKGVSTDGANYSSHLFQITLKSKGKPDLKLFSKVAAIGKELRDRFNVEVFNAEQIFYEEIAPANDKLLNEHSIPPEYRFHSPKFYGICTKYLEEVLIMEDLVNSGYGMYDRHVSVNLEYAKAAVTQLAYYHAFSRVYANENPEGFKRLVQSTKINLEFGAAFSKQAPTFIQNALKDVEEEYKERFEKFARSDKGPENMIGLYKPLETTFITHADFRASNLMHKIENGVYNICAVDYQGIMPGCPAGDLIYFLFLGTDEEFRKKHFKDIVDYYYEQLASQLKRFQLDPEVVYSKKEWERDFKDKLPYGLTLGILLLPVILVDGEDAPDPTQITEFADFVVKPGKEYRERLNGIIRDFVRWELI